MNKKLWWVLVLAVALSGCASSRGKKAEPAPAPESTYTSSLSEPVETEAAATEQVLEPAAGTQVTAQTLSKKDVQTCLKNAGYYQGPIDGKFGPKTRQAIKEFQKDNGLVVDGLAGKQTRAALLKYYNEKVAQNPGAK